MNPAVRCLSAALAVLICATAVCAEPPKSGTPDSEAREKRAAELKAKLANPIGVKFHNAFLDEVVEEISSRHDISILQQVPIGLRRQPVSSEDRNQPLGEALQKMLKPLGLEAQNQDGVLTIARPPNEASHLRDVLHQRVDLKFDKVPLSKVLDEIARKHDIKIEQKYREPEVGQTPITIDESWVPLDEALRQALRPLNVVCMNRGNRLVVSQRIKLSEEDAAAYAWFKQPITATWKKAPLEILLGEISENEHIEIRLDETVPETQRNEPITLEAKHLPLHEVCHRLFAPRGLVLRVSQGRILVRLWPIGSEEWAPKIAGRLREPSHFECIDVPLQKVLQMLASRHHVKFVLDIPKDGDISPDTRITLFSDELHGSEKYVVDTTLRGALYRLLVPLQLTVELRDGVLHVVEATGE